MSDSKTEIANTERKTALNPITIGDDGTIHVKNVEGQLLFGSRDEAFIHGITANIVYVANTDNADLDNHSTSFVASIVEGIEPRDQLEAMLATQMAAVHLATMRASRWLQKATTIPQVDNAENALNKLSRTFTTQMETLKKYRSEGHPVKVRDVNVSEGGQAIVGNVSTGAKDAKT